MISQQNAPIIISLGGSLIYPNDGLNVIYLKKLRKFILNQVNHGRRFIIICGGGAITRQYQSALSQIIKDIPNEDLDWLGTHATRLNAQLLRTVLPDVAKREVYFHYQSRLESTSKPVVVAAGWKPGWSTDYCAVLLARDNGASTILNLSNISAVYDKDPKIYPDAKPIKQILWDDFEKLVGNKWIPGANLPFDPIATKLAKSLGLTVFITRGDDLENVNNALQGKPFKGTIVMSKQEDTSFYNREYFELGIGYRGYTTTKTGRVYAHLANFYRALLIKIFLRPKLLLDVGCATGLLVYYLRKIGVQAYGLEISKYALSRARPDISKYLQYGNILKLPFKDNSFDVVTTFNVFEHMHPDLIKQALSECERVSKNKSLHKIFTIENRWMRKFYGADISKVSIYPKKWWLDLLKDGNYQLSKDFFPNLGKQMETIFMLEKPHLIAEK